MFPYFGSKKRIAGLYPAPIPIRRRKRDPSVDV